MAAILEAMSGSKLSGLPDNLDLLQPRRYFLPVKRLFNLEHHSFLWLETSSLTPLQF